MGFKGLIIKLLKHSEGKSDDDVNLISYLEHELRCDLCHTLNNVWNSHCLFDSWSIRCIITVALFNQLLNLAHIGRAVVQRVRNWVCFIFEIIFVERALSTS